MKLFKFFQMRYHFCPVAVRLLSVAVREACRPPCRAPTDRTDDSACDGEQKPHYQIHGNHSTGPVLIDTQLFAPTLDLLYPIPEPLVKDRLILSRSLDKVGHLELAGLTSLLQTEPQEVSLKVLEITGLTRLHHKAVVKLLLASEPAVLSNLLLADGQMAATGKIYQHRHDAASADSAMKNVLSEYGGVVTGDFSGHG